MLLATALLIMDRRTSVFVKLILIDGGTSHMPKDRCEQPAHPEVFLSFKFKNRWSFSISLFSGSPLPKSASMFREIPWQETKRPTISGVTGASSSDTQLTYQGVRKEMRHEPTYDMIANGLQLRMLDAC